MVFVAWDGRFWMLCRLGFPFCENVEPRTKSS